NGFVNDAVTAIAQDYSGLLWIGTEAHGLYTFDPLKKEFSDFSKSHDFPAKTVNCIVVNKEGTVIIATTDGVFFYYPETKKIVLLTTMEGLLHNNVLNIFIDDKNRIWFSSNGSAPYYMQDGKFTVLNEIPGLRFFNTNSITQDKSGLIWISTDGDGVVSYDGTKFVNYSVEDGLLSNYCYFITSDNAGNIWVGHKNGLSLKNKNDTVFKSLAKADGLLITDFNKNSIVKDFNGDIWFGTNDGLIRYNYDVGRKIKDEPQTNILGITIDNDQYVPGNDIDLSYGEYSVHLDFISISLNDPSKVKYKYRLIGQDTTWRYTQLKFVDFPKLADGDYTFELIGGNGDNIWNAKPATVHFTIARPFWKKLWFYFILLLIIIGISYSITRYRIKALTKAKRILEEKVDEKTLQLKTEKDIVEKIKTELEIKNRDNTDSLIYAKRIQESVLPSLKFIAEKLPKSFVFFVPRDIVSGDFYWFTETPDYYIIAAVDCTGHGVPGAFMSLVGSTLLNEIVINEKHTRPAEILTALNKSVIKVLKQENEIGSSNDGMDMAIVRIDKNFKKLVFAGALRPLYLIRNKTLTEIKGDSHSIGGYFENISNVFTEHEVALLPNDMIYIFSDGYCDQFGQETDKKFSTKRFKELV
ncbi:MAG TPA: two-component regulator propeller domain-containing protein, partial [Bacteroidia bacterium]|nr:two-component regulator propeller domain-containing protein [Bacteroidia bacterium]